MKRCDVEWHTGPLPAYSCCSQGLYVHVMEEVPEFVLRAGPDYAYVQAARHLELRIRAGQLAPGARLPSERALAAEYGIALGTIRKAIAILKDKGLVHVTPHLGVFITEPPQE
jgi:DNA-binding GntR family transcriptional regulator